ncbi:hypothetical protein H5410_026724 [Solanum commersonii]|uniref:Uncharacterized protein n=1 Tax=Solanum commersonii TaxID=4109 RepID=A0A9J5YZN6_SOLCO|nr:hypothetical protein H5410_026724 [Solanum commersonii]
MIVEEENKKFNVDCSTLGLKAVSEENDITTLLTTAKHFPKPRYKNPNAFCDHCKTNGDVGRFVGGNSHIRTHTHGTVGFHRSSVSRIPGFGVFTQASEDMCIPGYGNVGTHGHGVDGINMAFTGDVIFREDEYPFKYNLTEFPETSLINPPEMFVYDDQHTPILLPAMPATPSVIGVTPELPLTPTAQAPLSLPSEVTIPTNNEPSPRRSSRSSKQLGWLHGFFHTVASSLSHPDLCSTAHLISIYISYASISLAYFQSLCNFSAISLTPIDVALVGLSLDDGAVTGLTLVYVVLVDLFPDAKAVTGLTSVDVELVGPSPHAKAIAGLMPVNVALVVLSTNVEAFV